jgi:two-component system, cell cycle sensor histidine kinase and response regulator CckA
MSEAFPLGEFGSPSLLEAIRQAAQNARIGLAVTLVDVEQPCIVYMNDRVAELAGRPREEIAELGVWACLAPEARAELLDHHQRSLAHGEPRRTFYETMVLRPDGQRVPIEIAQSETVIEGRKIAVSFLFDLRDRRRALEALAESERRFRHVVEDAPDGVVVLRGPRMVFLNKRAADLLGLARPEDGYGRMITEFLHPEDALRARERIMKLLQTGKSFAEPAEYRSRASDGREKVVEISSIPIELDGEPAVVAFARDITERKAIQTRLVQADRLSALGVLSAGVAHEINNPLAYVLLNLEYLERELAHLGSGPAVDGLVTRVRDARHGAERVASIVRDLRTFARGDEGMRGPVRLTSVLESALNIAHSEIEQRARIVRSFQEVPPVDGNSNRLEQVFMNLLLNAAQAIEPGAPEANVIGISVRREGPRVCVDISDTGAGIADSVRSSIFDPFFTTKPPGVGTGLGLPICQSIVRALGGDISVHSELGKGSTFSVALPLWAGEGNTARTPLPAVPAKAAPRGRVLIVDDEIAVGRTLSLVLGSEHDVTVVTSGEEALALLNQSGGEVFDAVLCDLVMPGMTGLELFQTLQSKVPDLASRVIFMTGGMATRQPAEVLSIPNPLFEKPFDLDQIRTTLRDVVVARRALAPNS